MNLSGGLNGKVVREHPPRIEVPAGEKEGARSDCVKEDRKKKNRGYRAQLGE